MRKLTLNEKISIKGELSKRLEVLPKLTMESALHYWVMCFGTPLSYYNTGKRFYKANSHATYRQVYGRGKRITRS